jgi:hypothetical protein
MKSPFGPLDRTSDTRGCSDLAGVSRVERAVELSISGLCVPVRRFSCSQATGMVVRVRSLRKTVSLKLPRTASTAKPWGATAT